MSGGSRVSIPSVLRQTIQDIKEVARKHSDDDIYTMLKECNMDPNETAQRLLYLDTFHEVKKKRDRRKVIVSSRTSEDSMYAPGMQGRGARGGRGDYSSSYISYDAVGGRNVSARKENGVNQSMRGSRPLPVSQKAENNPTPHFSSSSHERAPQSSAVNNSNLPKGSSTTDANEERTAPPPPTFDAKQPPAPVAPGDSIEEGKSTSSFSELPNPVATSVSGVYSSASDPIIVPVQNSRVSNAVGTIKRQVRNQSIAAKSGVSVPTGRRSSSAHDVANGIQAVAVTVNSTNGMRPRISQEVKNSQLLEPSQPLSPPMDDGCSVIDSNQDCQTPKQLISPPKVVKSEATIAVEASSQSLPPLNVSALKEATSKLDMKLEKLVIFPDHLQVPEAFKNGLTFGSLDLQVPEANSIQENDEVAREVSQSNPSSISQEGESFDHPQSPRVPENLSPLEDNISAGAVSNYDQLKQEMVLPLGPQYPLVQTTPNYTFAFSSPMPGSQLVQSEGPETQACDIACLLLPFVYQYFMYLFFHYIFPFTMKILGGHFNIFDKLLMRKDGGNALALSTSGSTPPVTQPAGGVQSSTAVSPHPVFRQPYPPNYFPYGPYFPGFMPHYSHQFLGPGVFPQQPSTGNAYLPPTAAAPGVKLANIPQGKPGTNAVNLSHLGLPLGYGLYNTPVGYNTNSAVISGSSAGNEDPAAATLKENNLYTKVQQTEGPLLWVSPSGRDNISNLQANSFYNLHQGQHFMFSPAQVGHGAYTGVYHPAPTMVASSTAPPQLIPSQAMGGPVETVGPPPVFPQSQHALGWNRNC
ncbi:GBF-interacting protein 1-like [Cornus florida]|uniref:GBF-interacting protein 1-like n=1 Tax=Cornus florida TaxID=4283 RepID=UPI0028979A0C|nr:GBF-interacting protein 1-like [Cornus florida]